MCPNLVPPGRHEGFQLVRSPDAIELHLDAANGERSTTAQLLKV
jgi:hypothetical protein